MGHSCLRLQCPTHDLDFIFSNEGEDASQQILRFFAGKLMMGTFAIPTSEYLQQYAKEGRGVKEYVLNLPVHVKQRLWQQMDERLEQPHVPYDYMNRGCTVSVLSWIEAAITTDSLQYGEWSDEFRLSRKEIARNHYPPGWKLLFVSSFIAGEGHDLDVYQPRKVMAPELLPEVLGKATAFGEPLIVEKPRVLLADTRKEQQQHAWFTPLAASILILIIAIANVRLHWSAVRWLCISIMVLFGSFIAYLIFFSSLPCTEWNWLIVPFNPLPLLLWRWRRYWLMPYAIAIGVWIAVLAVYPYYMFEEAHLVLAGSMALVCIEDYLYLKQ